MPIAGQWLNYFNDQKQFYKYLSHDIKSLSKVRLYPNDNDWFQKNDGLKLFLKLTLLLTMSLSKNLCLIQKLLFRVGILLLISSQ